MSMNIEIIVGTYEEFLLGYKLTHKNDEQVLTQSFADKSHTGAIKCLSVQGKYIATGGTDDRIFIYDMKKRKQSQILLNHEGTVNAIAFTSDNTHILSAGDDGRMVAVRLNTWQVGANWTKAHNGAKVTHISCHPSGKLALSLGSDLILRTWNLVKGRVAYKTNLKNKLTLGSTPDCLSWSPEGEYFSITGPRNIDIWSIKNADIHKSEKTKSKPICVSWSSDDILVCGMEDGSILFVSVNEDDETVSINAHSSRVKAISISDDKLVSASSSGELKLWKIDALNRKLTEVAVTNIGCRPTCIGILDLDQFGTEHLKPDVPVAKEETPTLQVEERAPKERGVVTIEYDNDTDEETTTEVLEENEDESKSQRASKKRKCNEESKSEGKLNASKTSGKKTKKNKKVNGSKNAT